MRYCESDHLEGGENRLCHTSNGKSPDPEKQIRPFQPGGSVHLRTLPVTFSQKETRANGGSNAATRIGCAQTSRSRSIMMQIYRDREAMIPCPRPHIRCHSFPCPIDVGVQEKPARKPSIRPRPRDSARAIFSMKLREDYYTDNRPSMSRITFSRIIRCKKGD